MEEHYVDQIMSQPVETVSPTTTLQDAAAEMVRHDVGALVVLDDADRFRGLLTEADFVLLARDGRSPSDSAVAEVMRTDVVTTSRVTPVSEAATTMLDHLVHHVPVVDGGEVVGMLTSMDVASSFVR
ncbi:MULTISPECIES: cyclic nucleotide-binding/CBS domain-containing protein [Salinibaculum]|uniref:CBS domain-containing protein n=1 Tax=Salinibaculum TaxID=2732368 RepID=UPI0030CBF716